MITSDVHASLLWILWISEKLWRAFRKVIVKTLPTWLTFFVQKTNLHDLFYQHLVWTWYHAHMERSKYKMWIKNRSMDRQVIAKH